jgi:hypothetical protein
MTNRDNRERKSYEMTETTKIEELRQLGAEAARTACAKAGVSVEVSDEQLALRIAAHLRNG